MQRRLRGDYESHMLRLNELVCNFVFVVVDVHCIYTSVGKHKPQTSFTGSSRPCRRRQPYPWFIPFIDNRTHITFPKCIPSGQLRYPAWNPRVYPPYNPTCCGRPGPHGYLCLHQSDPRKKQRRVGHSSGCWSSHKMSRTKSKISSNCYRNRKQRRNGRKFFNKELYETTNNRLDCHRDSLLVHETSSEALKISKPPCLTAHSRDTHSPLI